MTSGEGWSGQRRGDAGSVSVSGDGRACLADLAPGTRATVVGVVPAGSHATARRLGELGFTPGTVVEVVRRAPLRDPVIYRVKDYEVCLRRSEASYVRTAEVG